MIFHELTLVILLIVHQYLQQFVHDLFRYNILLHSKSSFAKIRNGTSSGKIEASSARLSGNKFEISREKHKI